MAEPNQLTVLVFKDNFSSRTFQIPLGWITRFGLVLFTAAGICCLLIALFIRNYSVLSFDLITPQLQKMEKAEKQITDESPAETETPASPKVFQLFQGLPSGILQIDSSTLPIRLDKPSAYWIGARLRVQFDIEYFKEDGGAQSGRIVVLARGRGGLLVYPPQVMDMSEGNSILIHPSRGEYFSLRRMRRTQATFSWPYQRSDIKQVSVLVFSTENELLLKQTIEVSTPASAPKSEKSESGSETSGSEE